MIFEDSDSGGEATDGSSQQPHPGGGGGGVRHILPVVQTVQVQERERFGSVPGIIGGNGGGHERSPSLPVAPQVNVEEVGDAFEGYAAGGRNRQLRGGGLSSRGHRVRGGHVKAPSADWSVDFGRKGSPSDFSFDSDSSESPLPVPLHLPNHSHVVRTRTSTMDSDTLALSLGGGGGMPMMKQGSELSDTGSLIVPTVRGMTISDDSADDGDSLNQELKLLYLMVARCIAYPFNAKYQLETAPPKPKLNEERFRSVVDILDTCRNQDWEGLGRSAVSLSNAETKCLHGEKFLSCLDWYVDNVLGREDVVAMSRNGGASP